MGTRKPQPRTTADYGSACSILRLIAGLEMVFFFVLPPALVAASKDPASPWHFGSGHNHHNGHTAPHTPLRLKLR